MATPRLPFLYPNLMRAVKSCEPSTYRSVRVPSRPLPPSQAAFHSARRHAQEAYHRRYGPAVEPNIPPPDRPKGEPAQQQQAPNPSPEKASNDSSPPEHPQQSPDTKSSASEPASHQESQQANNTTKPIGQDKHHAAEPELEPVLDMPESQQGVPTPDERPSEEQPQQEQQQNASPLQNTPLERVLHMPSPSSYLTPSNTTLKTNMTPAPYVHHFDSYTLVRDLSKGGFSDEQSVTIMKAVRRILQNNLDFANHNLTSKSDVENESYLFQAACSELQSSLQTARNAETQRQRASRTHLQHESDILSQRLNQELAGLKDDIKGMFNDHKMTTRELQRSIDTSVQELNYKITVSLNSEAKSEIEGLRWILTRRAALAMATSAFMIILFLKYYSVRKQDDAGRKKETAPKKPTEAASTPVSEFAPTHKDPGPTAVHLSESLG